MEHKFLVHDSKDSVGVAVADIKTGEVVKGVFLEDNSMIEVKAVSDIPLGHKIALKDIPEGTKVVKYNVFIGNAYKSIVKGEHVHVQNLKTARW